MMEMAWEKAKSKEIGQVNQCRNPYVKLGFLDPPGKGMWKPSKKARWLGFDTKLDKGGNYCATGENRKP